MGIRPSSQIQMASVAAEFDEKPFNLLVYLGNLSVSWT